MNLTLALKDLGYTHRDIYRHMSPKEAIVLWRATPDPDLMPKRSDDPSGMLQFVM